MKMRDPEYGGYYDRVTPDSKVINDNKTGFSSFALYSLAHAGRVTGDKKYLDAAMVLFREMRDKMRDGPFIGSGSYSRDFMKRAPGGVFGGGGRGAPAPGAAEARGGAPAGPRSPRPPAARRAGPGSRAPAPAQRRAGTASTCTCSKRCSRCTKPRNPRKSGTRSTRAESHRSPVRLQHRLSAGRLRRRLEAGRQPERQSGAPLRVGVASEPGGRAGRRSEVHRARQPESRSRFEELQRGRSAASAASTPAASRRRCCGGRSAR